MAEGTTVCIPVPQPEVITIPLPFGAELKSIIDASKPPSDCAIVHSLMLQLTPLLASMACLLKMLKVFAGMKEVTDAISIPPSPTAPVDVLTAVVEKVVPPLLDLVNSCVISFNPCNIAKMISAILAMLIRFLLCFIQAIESILQFQVGIDLDAAQGNPVLLASLSCAKDNADASLMTVSQALEAIQPILDLISPLLELAGIPPIELPDTEFSTGSLADQFKNGEDPLKPVKDVLAVLTEVKQTVDAICGAP